MTRAHKIHSANLVAQDLRIGIVISRWHQIINENLLNGALDTLERHGNKLELVETFYVPGSFEIPLTAKILAQKKKYEAIICLGTIIRGNTLHFDLIANELVKGIASCSLETLTPISLGVLATDNLEQALERSGSKQGNKGSEAALAAIEMANLLKSI